MRRTEKIICITCPKGCTLEVTRDGQTILEIKNQGCCRGEKYVQRELTDPRRLVATTIKIRDALHPLLPVYTSEAFPKPRIYELMDTLREMEVTEPVKMGDVILKNALNTGIDILASRDSAQITQIINDKV